VKTPRLRPLAHAFAALSALLAIPLGAAALLVRPRWWDGLSARLGFWPRMPGGGVWIHAAAVGEILAASRLVDLVGRSGRPLCTSTRTLPGRAAMRRWRPDLPCHLAPIDHPWCAEAALARVAPSVLVLVETELWPSWIAAAHRRHIPVVLVSGRLSDRSFPRYRRLAPIFAPTLRRLHAVGARTELDAERFRALGVPADRVVVMGDLKLDVETKPPSLAPDLAALLGDVPLLVAGSTHAGEERAALDALDAAERAGLSPALVIAPRHPPRAGEVERLARRRGHPTRRRTRPGDAALAPGEVLVLDTVGELAALYARAAAAFVGGSLVPVGGHNVLEPAQAGRPVLFGPHTANVRHAVEILEGCGAGRRVDGPGELARAAVELLRDPAAAVARGERGRRALEDHRGAAQRALALVESALGATRVG
jgi:3-deoxy-D-manno-octulosonic-acid transferase